MEITCMNLWQVIKSVLAAMLGVQSNKVRERDFTEGSPAAFIIVGIVIAVIFVLLLYGIVQWVLASHH